MDNELVRMASGQVAPSFTDRKVAKKAKAVYDEVRVAGLKADGLFALTGHIMEGVATLDAKRNALAQGDPGMSAMLMEYEKNALRGAAVIQSNVFNDWGL